jgi:hypothetical protein
MEKMKYFRHKLSVLINGTNRNGPGRLPIIILGLLSREPHHSSTINGGDQLNYFKVAVVEGDCTESPAVFADGFVYGLPAMMSTLLRNLKKQYRTNKCMQRSFSTV